VSTLGLSDSLSGSESTSEGEQDSDIDRVGQLLARSKLSKSSRPSTPTPVRIPRTALVCFHSAPSTQLRVYNAVFPQEMEQGEYVSELKSTQEPKPEGRMWTMIMIAGGHFAAIIVRVQGPIEEEPAAPSRKGKQRKPKQDYEILLHKTFHRYTSMLVYFAVNLCAPNFPSSATETGRLPICQ
jgi:Bacteroidetes VLRF1 release factor